jgi:hypothetical protein
MFGLELCFGLVEQQITAAKISWRFVDLDCIGPPETTLFFS